MPFLKPSLTQVIKLGCFHNNFVLPTTTNLQNIPWCAPSPFSCHDLSTLLQGPVSHCQAICFQQVQFSSTFFPGMHGGGSWPRGSFVRLKPAGPLHKELRILGAVTSKQDTQITRCGFQTLQPNFHSWGQQVRFSSCLWKLLPSDIMGWLQSWSLLVGPTPWQHATSGFGRGISGRGHVINFCCPANL